MGEPLWGVRGARPSRWDLRDHDVGRDREVCVRQGVCHVCQRFQKRAEKLGRVYPPHQQDQVNADDFSLIPWCRWDDARKRAHLRRIISAAVVCVCDFQFGHPDQTLDRVRLSYRLQDAGEGPTKLQQLQSSLHVGGLVDTGRV